MFNLNSKKINLAILLVIFFISVAVRLPNLNRPLSSHHEWLTSLSLRIISIFYDNGAYRYNFNPITTYGGAANKNIDNTSALFMPRDADGNYYYASYMPFAYLFPYFIFKLITSQPTILGIQIFSLILHFISAYFIFLIVSLLNGHNDNRINWAGTLGFTIYTFLPLNLWFHSNIYMAEIFVQPIFIIEIYLILKILFSESVKNYYYWLLGVINFLIIYTEWLGILLAGTIGLYSLFMIKDNKYRKILCIIAVTSTSSLLLTIYQYSMIAGFKSLILSYYNKYNLRSGFSDLSPLGTKFSEARAWMRLINIFILNYLSFIMVLLLPLFVQNSKKLTASPHILLTIYIIVTPIAIHHLIFFSGTVIHDFFLLKDSIYIAIFGALIFQYFTSSINKKRQLIIFSTIILIGASSSIMIYGQSNSRYFNYYKIIGEKINQTAEKDEVAFLKFNNKRIKQADITPQFIIYAQRNIKLWQGDDQANELIKKNKLNKGVVFTVNENYDISEISRINLRK